MKLNRTNTILAALMLIQALAVAVLALAGRAAPIQNTGAPLLAGFDPETVTQVAFQDADKNEVVVMKDAAGVWTLANGYPITETRIAPILNSIKSFDTGRLIAQNRSSHTRLKVADDTFERRIEVKRGDTVDTLFLGSSTGANATHVRLGGSDSVYLVSGLSAFEVPTSAVSWVNPIYFSIDQSIIQYLKVENANGVFEFRRDGESLVFSGLGAGEIANPTLSTSLTNNIASIRLDAPLGKELKPEYGMDKPLAVITIQTRREIVPTPTALVTNTPDPLLPPITPQPVQPQIEEKSYTIQIGAKLDEGYIVKSSESEFYVRIAAFGAEYWVNMARDKVIATPTPTPTVDPNLTPTIPPTLEMTPSPIPTVTLTPMPTEVSTLEPTTEATAEATIEATGTPGN